MSSKMFDDMDLKRYFAAIGVMVICAAYTPLALQAGSFTAIYSSIGLLICGIVVVMYSSVMYRVLNARPTIKPLLTLPFQYEAIPLEQCSHGRCVYVLRDASITGWFKVGYTEDIHYRVLRLSDTKLPIVFNLQVIRVFYTEQHKELERHLHKQFKHCHKQGEWFDLNVRDLERLIRVGNEWVADDIASDWQQVR